jgi:glycosyltransferase involved in cell wall biosynthesis
MFPRKPPHPSILTGPLNIVIGAHTPHGTPYVVGSHHIARELKRMGHRVFHITIPLGPQDLFVADHSNFRSLRWSGWKTTRRRLDQSQADLFLITCLPWMLVRRLGFRRAERLAFGALTFPNIKALANPDILIVDHPKQFWLVNMLKPKLLLYRPTDAYSFPGHKDDNIYKEIESWLLRRSDGAVLTASETAMRMLSLCDGFEPPPMRVLENGVDLSAFVTGSSTLRPPALQQLPHPRLLYIGSFDNRIDYDFITAAARQLPGYSFVLGGPMTPIQISMFSSCSNVTLLGPVAYGELLRYMEHCDVGFMPMNDHAFNATRSPMKLYEFAACGLPMVAKATPELKRRSLPFCFIYDSFPEFRTAIDRALAYKLNGTDEMHRLAKERSWVSITSRLLAFCDEINSDPPDRPRESRS